MMFINDFNYLTFRKHYYLPVILLLALLQFACSSKPTHTIKHADHSLVAATFSSDLHYALIATVSEPAALWDLTNNKPLYAWSLTKDKGDPTVDHVALNSKQNLALTAGDHQVVLWNIKNGKAISEKVFKSGIRTIALAANRPWVLVGSDDYNAYYFAINTNQLQWHFSHQGSINSVALSADGRFALTASDDKQAKLWDLKTGKLLHNWPHKKKVSFVTFSADSQYALTNASQGGAYIWSTETGEQIAQLGRSPMSITAAAFSADNKQIVTGNTRRQMILWSDAGKKQKSWYLPKESFWRPETVILLAVAFDQENNQIISEDSSGFFRTWSLS